MKFSFWIRGGVSFQPFKGDSSVSDYVTETQLVMSTITDVTYDRMKTTVKRVFDKEIGSFHSGQNSAMVKTDPVFYSEAHNIDNEVMYTSRLRWQKLANHVVDNFLVV